LVIAVSVFSASTASAQLVSIRCCTEETHLAAVDDCVSGDGELSQPKTCPAGATCVLQFGEDAALAGRLCDPRQLSIPHPTRGHCNTWEINDAAVAHECVAVPALGVNLFTVWDDDGDGDVDESDVALFEAAAEVVPKIEQSLATLTFLECCFADFAIMLSGPGIAATSAEANCLAGFTKPVEAGDYLHELCASTSPEPIEPAMGFCVTWHSASPTASFFCPASSPATNDLFVIADEDEDGDVDLFDFAAFQNDLMADPS
jgi:hypothetical protein